MQTERKKGPGRPSKGPKVSVRIRRSVLDRFRRAIGPAMILCEAVEQAILEKMSRGGQA
jgi:hypothetical protein